MKIEWIEVYSIYITEQWLDFVLYQFNGVISIAPKTSSPK